MFFLNFYSEEIKINESKNPRSIKSQGRYYHITTHHVKNPLEESAWVSAMTSSASQAQSDLNSCR